MIGTRKEGKKMDDEMEISALSAERATVRKKCATA
jgi:hypothetical protein